MSFKNSLRRLYHGFRPPRPVRVLGVELANLCNLHCAYCLRDEDMLYGKARFLEVSRLFGLLDGARDRAAHWSVALTGGEPLLHPRFGEVVRGLADRAVPYRIVTNGWHFERVFDDLRPPSRRPLAIAFSVDAATRAAHDAIRGAGSFDRVMRAVALCETAGLPFQFNVVLRKDTLPQMEMLSMLAARLGAQAVNFGALLPTTLAVHQEWGLSRDQEMEGRREAAALSRTLRIPVRIAFGLYDEAAGAHCPALQGRSLTLDYQGRLRLCGNLSSFRGASGEQDVPAAAESLLLSEGFQTVSVIGNQALRARDSALAMLAKGQRPNPILGSPCLSCLSHFDKLNGDVRAALLTG